MQTRRRARLVVVPHVEVICLRSYAFQIHGIRAEEVDVDLIPELCGESEEQRCFLGVCCARLES